MSDFLDLTTHSYCKTAFAPSADELINNAEMQLVGQNIDFDSMVGIGNSGLLVMPLLARHFNVPFFAMRKPGILHHNSRQPIGDGIIGKRWILVDDVTVTGGTMTYVSRKVRHLAQENNFYTQCAGTYLYEPMSMSPGEFIYPDDTKKCVQRIVVDDQTTYVNFGEYSKVREVWNRLYNPDLDVVGLVINAVMQAYPRWNADTVSLIAHSLLKDHNVS